MTVAIVAVRTVTATDRADVLTKGSPGGGPFSLSGFGHREASLRARELTGVDNFVRPAAGGYEDTTIKYSQERNDRPKADRHCGAKTMIADQRELGCVALVESMEFTGVQGSLIPWKTVAFTIFWNMTWILALAWLSLTIFDLR